MISEVKKIIFSLKNNQFSVFPNKEFYMPKFKGILSTQNITKEIKDVVFLTDSGWKKQEDEQLNFSPFKMVKGEKKIHFRKARRNSRNKKKGFRAIYLQTKINVIC